MELTRPPLTACGSKTTTTCYSVRRRRFAEALRRYREHGFSTVIADAPAPYDQETIERLATEVPSLLVG